MAILATFIVPYLRGPSFTEILKLPRLARPSFALCTTATITPTSRRSKFAMAWRSHGSSNDELVDKLAENGLIEDDRVKEAMKKVHSLSLAFPRLSSLLSSSNTEHS